MRKFSIVERSSGWYVVSDIGAEAGPLDSYIEATLAIEQIIAQEIEEEPINMAEAMGS